MGGIDILHKIKRKSGDELREEEGSVLNQGQNQDEPRIEVETQRAGSLVRSAATYSIQTEITNLTRENV
jgi:hypothetical protein